MTLRLVHPAREGQATRPPKRFARSNSLNPDERRHLRQALKNLRAKLGTWCSVAEALDVPYGSLRTVASRNGRGSRALAVRAARASGTTVEALLLGTLAPAGSCPTCGHAADRRVA